MVLNKKFIKNIGVILFSLLLIAGMLFLPKVSVRFALAGLNLWFTKMIPTLFPFMVVSGILIRMQLVKPLCAPFTGLFSHLFGVQANGVFCILMGFLCGFPMGAKVISDLYKRGELTIEEADYLLSFCNNIGPIYFCGYVLVTLQIANPIPFLFGMYGIPFLYGMVQGRLRKKKCIPAGKQLCMGKCYAASGADKALEPQNSFLEAVDGAIMSGIENITKLGGYMIFFNLFNMLPRLLMQKGLAAGCSYAARIKMTYFFACFFEISGGVSLVQNKEPWLILAMIPFGGLCCMAQTYSLIKDTPLSIAGYAFHKLCITALTAGYLFLLSRSVSL